MVDLRDVQLTPRFAGIPPREQQWLAERLVRRRYGKGEMIFLEGDACAHLHLIESGVVKVFKTLESGRELILNLFRSGDAIGEVALMDGIEYPASAEAMEPTAVLSLSGRDYFALLERNPAATRAVIRDLTLRIMAMRRRVEELGEGGVEYRLAQVLSAFGRRVGERRGRGLLIPVQLSRQELADMVGARIETVIRIMSRWHKAGQVRTEREGFWLPAAETLERLSQTSH